MSDIYTAQLLKQYTDTSKRTIRTVCPQDHIFIETVFVSINKETDDVLFEQLSVSGIQAVTCPNCGRRCVVAEPVFLHDPQNQRFALFIPDILLHRELELRAELYRALAETDLSDLPWYFTEPQILRGPRCLEPWLSSRAPVHRVDSTQPEIHEAFIDLLQSKSAPPPPYIAPYQEIDQDTSPAANQEKAEWAPLNESPEQDGR